MDFIWALAKIVILNYILFLYFNKQLMKSIVLEQTKGWIWKYSIVSFLLPIMCRFFNQTDTFSFSLSVVFVTFLQGFSVNFKEPLELYELVESLQKKTMKYAIAASILGYLSYLDFVIHRLPVK